jgi:hypothetical protein
MSQSSLPNSMKNTLQAAKTAPPASINSSHKDGNPSGYDNGTQANKSSSGHQRKAKGYRPGSPYSRPSFHKPGSPTIEGDLEIISDGENEAAEITSCTEYTRNDSSTPLILSGSGEEEADETHVSSDGASSSSYGDIDIDPTALEDACKMYDA